MARWSVMAQAVVGGEGGAATQGGGWRAGTTRHACVLQRAGVLRALDLVSDLLAHHSKHTALHTAWEGHLPQVIMIAFPFELSVVPQDAAQACLQSLVVSSMVPSQKHPVQSQSGASSKSFISMMAVTCPL